MTKRVLGGILIVWFALGGWIKADETTIYHATVSAADQQTIKGWGCVAGDNYSGWFADFTDKKAAQQAILVDLGITVDRILVNARLGRGDGSLVLDVPAPGNSYVDQLAANIDIVRQKGLPHYYLCFYSCPREMKTVATDGSLDSKGNKVYLRPDKYDAFAVYVVNLLDYIKNKGLPPPLAISLQNEPNAPVTYDSCLYEKDQYRAVIKKIRAKMDAAGYADVALIAAELASYEQIENYLGPHCSLLRSDPQLGHAVGAICAHSYRPWIGKDYWVTAKDQQAWDQVLQTYAQATADSGRDLWQSEVCGDAGKPGADEFDPKYQLNTALDLTRCLAADMAFVQNNYWFFYRGWSDDTYAKTYPGEVLAWGNGVDSVTKAKLYYVLQKIFRNAPPGSVVRRVDSTDPGFITQNAHRMDMVAFRHGPGMTLVLTNPTASDHATILLGLTGTKADIYQTTLTQDMAPVATVPILVGKIANPLILPAKSITVVVTSG